MGPERRGRAVHGRVEVNPSGEEPTDGPKQKKLKSFEIPKSVLFLRRGRRSGRTVERRAWTL